MINVVGNGVRRNIGEDRLDHSRRHLINQRMAEIALAASSNYRGLYAPHFAFTQTIAGKDDIAKAKLRNIKNKHLQAVIKRVVAWSYRVDLLRESRPISTDHGSPIYRPHGQIPNFAIDRM